MHVFTLILALFAALALSSPVEKRGRRGYYTTEVDVVTVTEYLTLDSLPSTTNKGKFHRPAVSATSSAAPVVSSSSSSLVAPSSNTTPAPDPVPSSSSTADVDPFHGQPTTTSAAAPPPPPSSSAAAPASTAAPAPVLSGGSDLQSMVLDSHNVHRANHSAPALVWDDNLASIANTIAQSCVYAHNTQAGGGGYGQNIGAGLQASEINKLITDMMYNDEMMFYPGYGVDSPDMSNFEKWGHYSQIVWHGTTSVGCAVVQCSSLANVASNVPPVFTVCNYKPPGNMAGSYTNVGKPLGQPVVTA